MGRTKNRSRKDQTAKAKDAAPFGESALTQQLSAASNAYTSGDFPGAKRICEAILNKAPNNITALEVLGTAELELDEPDLAKEHFLQALKAVNKEKVPPSIHLNLAQLADTPQEALTYFNEALRLLLALLKNLTPQVTLDPTRNINEEEFEIRRSTSTTLVGMTELYLTDLCFEPDAEAKCEEYLKLASEVEPTDSEVYQTLASVRLSQSRDDEARQLLNQAWTCWRHLGPDNPLIPLYSARIGLATLMVETKQFFSALEILHFLELDDDQDPQLFYLTGLSWNLLAQAKREASLVQYDTGHWGKTETDLECASESRAALEACRTLLSMVDQPEEEDAKLLEQVQEILKELEAAGVPLPAEEEETGALLAEDDDWEDDDAEDIEMK